MSRLDQIATLIHNTLKVLFHDFQNPWISSRRDRTSFVGNIDFPKIKKSKNACKSNAVNYVEKSFTILMITVSVQCCKSRFPTKLKPCSSLDIEESLACQITSPVNNKLGCF